MAKSTSNPAMPKPGLRPFLPADAPILAEIFRASIHELTGEDYSETQQEAWAEAAEDEEAWGKRLAGCLTLVATVGGSPVGFIALKGKELVDLLYVHPAVAGQGVASTLYGAIEQLAKARGATQLTVDASDTARDFFQRQGFVPQQRNTVSRGDEWLGNTTMKKALVAPPDASRQ
ncbi:GNAT family N-acetyltransferase [Labrys sp. ZIDIC5]|uniref:GNAT family N-acetyltransferase n=1 Tax=Labrys sedimenti TaxID=3106036 RepID=UPI002ACA20C6|nr:GNAT family N-acetyltransferase [Labrys sp. ZIDIC5]MDZ5450148.1 GNAT family N-acetyltransferase [Labrys sp. ZIDIC5]